MTDFKQAISEAVQHAENKRITDNNDYISIPMNEWNTIKEILTPEKPWNLADYSIYCGMVAGDYSVYVDNYVRKCRDKILQDIGDGASISIQDVRDIVKARFGDL